MDVYFITFRSVTLAQRGKSLLDQKGIRCSVQRTPRWMEEKGCGYCLRLWTRQVQAAIEHLHSGQILFRKVYLQHPDGKIEEVVL